MKRPSEPMRLPALPRTAPPEPAMGLSVRPYPIHLAAAWRASDGTPLTIRPIHPDDEPLLVRFHEALSTETVYGRYFGYLKFGQRAAHRRLEAICHIDYDRVMVLVAERIDPVAGDHDIVGIGRLMKGPSGDEAEFALVVADAWQRRGIGADLLRRLVAYGRGERLRRIWGLVLADNAAMLRLCRRLGFEVRPGDEQRSMRVVLDL